MDAARGVTVTIVGQDDGARFNGAAILRWRPHPLSGEETLQLGVPDDALGFRPRPGASYGIHIEADSAAAETEHTARAVWLERVQSSWWFILEGSGRS